MLNRRVTLAFPLSSIGPLSAVLVLACCTGACGGQRSGSGLVSTEELSNVWSADGLAGELGAVLTADGVGHLVKDAGGLTFAAFEKRAGQDLQPGRVTLDGVPFEATADAIAAVGADWATIDRRYSSVKEYWAAIGFNPNSINQASVGKALKTLIEFKRGMQLQDTDAGFNLMGIRQSAADVCALNKLSQQCKTRAGTLAAVTDPNTYKTINNASATINAAVSVAKFVAPNSSSVANTVRKIGYVQAAARLAVNTMLGQETVNQNVSVKN